MLGLARVQFDGFLKSHRDRGRFREGARRTQEHRPLIRELVIADTGTINHLILIEHIELLPRLCEKAVLPAVVQAVDL